MSINKDESKTEASPTPLSDLILSLEQATLMAKQLAATNDPTHIFQIYSFLHQANHNLSSFLSNNTQLSPPPIHLPAAETSFSSATGANGGGGGEPMEVGDDDDDEDQDEEEYSKTAIDMVEERMRDCFIKNKRAKRPLSPSSMAAAEQKRLYEDGFVGDTNRFDPHGTKLRALELVYQFHG